jgi:isopentenyldiphosphate isomerase
VAARPELLDVVDSFGSHLGVKDRDAVHRDGDWHRVFHCLVLAQRPGLGPVAVLQRRSETKAGFPGLLDLSATGHLAAGEEPPDGVRELTEELGIEVDAAGMISVGVRRLEDTGGEGKVNRELAHVFFVTDDRPLLDYSPGPGEVDGVYDVPLGDGLRMFADDDHRIEVDAAEWIAGRLTPVRRTISRSDLVPGFDYWIVLFVMAERFLAGERPVAL